MGFHLLFVLKKGMFVHGENKKCSCKEKLVGTGLDSRKNNEMLRWKIHSTMDVVFSNWGIVYVKETLGDETEKDVWS